MHSNTGNQILDSYRNTNMQNSTCSGQSNRFVRKPKIANISEMCLDYRLKSAYLFTKNNIRTTNMHNTLISSECGEILDKLNCKKNIRIH